MKIKSGFEKEHYKQAKECFVTSSLCLIVAVFLFWGSIEFWRESESKSEFYFWIALIVGFSLFLYMIRAGRKINEDIISGYICRKDYEKHKSNISKNMTDDKINLSIGKDDKGNEITHDLGKLPVILMAGATGSGKSNLTEYFIYTLIKQFRPDDLNLVLFDCKQVEFCQYKNSSYLFIPISFCFNIDTQIFDKLEKEIETRKQGNNKKPFIFIIIDEFSDLMYYCPEKLEKLVELIAKDGSEIGIGLVLHTSRPCRDVITNKIDKAVQTRIGLATASDNDSEVIIHRKVCTELKGGGDGLYLRHIDSEPIHFQAPLISDFETRETAIKYSKEEKK